MNPDHKITTRLLTAALLLLPWSADAGWNDDLAAIDSQILAITGPTHQQGNAVNVRPGVSTATLEQKRLILADAGFTWFAPANSAGTYNYGNFYSFTGTAGQTDTQLRIVETSDTTLLYRRGYPNEPSQRLGAWWSAAYLSPDATRDNLAVLDAWGNPLTGIYVISVPAGTRMITGLASPMQAGAESRAGGTTQYWLNSRDNAWLVHALYAPDYLGSYVLALAGAQKLNRDATDGLTAQLRDLATREDRDNSPADGTGIESWFRATASDTDYQPGLEHEINARGHGLMLGWGKTLTGTSSTARLHAGVVLGRSSLRQFDAITGLEGHIDNTVGGIYAIYRRPAAERFPWYASGSVLHGRLWFDNSVPGYLGRGLQQSYRAHLTSASLEVGIPLSLGCGWTVTPQVQLAASQTPRASFIDELGATISAKQGHSSWARSGAQFERTLLQHSHRQLSVTAGGGAIREFSGGNKVEVSGEVVTGRRIRSVYQIDAGLRYAWAERYAIQSSVARLCGHEQGYRGSGSFNMAW